MSDTEGALELAQMTMESAVVFVLAMLGPEDLKPPAPQVVAVATNLRDHLISVGWTPPGGLGAPDSPAGLTW